MSDYKNQYWHCYVKKTNSKEKYKIVNDLTFAELQKQIIDPWIEERAFTVSGMIIRNSTEVDEIKITQTDHPQSFYAITHNEKMRQRGITDLATNRHILPLDAGIDFTFELLFEH